MTKKISDHDRRRFPSVRHTLVQENFEILRSLYLKTFPIDFFYNNSFHESSFIDPFLCYMYTLLSRMNLSSSRQIDSPRDCDYSASHSARGYVYKTYSLTLMHKRLFLCQSLPNKKG